MNEPTIRVGRYSFTQTRWVQILHEAEAGLRKNANDQQAKEAIKAAGQALGQSPPDEAQMASGQGTPESPASSIPERIKGIGDAIIDLPRGIQQLATHPIKALGQMTGIANIPNALRVGQDPEADWSDKLDAMFRALPTNMGYAPEAAAQEPGLSPREETRRYGNVASLALLGIGAGRGAKPAGFSRFEGGPLTPGVEPPTPGTPPVPPSPVDANWSPVPSEVPPTNPMLALPKPRAPVTTVTADMGRVQGQKGVTFGPESPLDEVAQANVKGILGEMANEHGSGTMQPIPGTSGRGFSALGPESPPARTIPKTLDYGSELLDLLDRQRAKMNQHTPEGIMGTDMLPPGSSDFNLGPNKGPDVPMGPEAGFLGGKMGEAATIMFSPRLYLLLKRLGRSPQDLVGASRQNAALSAVVSDLSTASLLGQPERIKQLEDQIASMLQNNGNQR